MAQRYVKDDKEKPRANLASTALHFSVFMSQTCSTELCQVLGTTIRISCSAPKPSNPVSRTDTRFTTDTDYYMSVFKHLVI